MSTNKRFCKAQSSYTGCASLEALDEQGSSFKCVECHPDQAVVTNSSTNIVCQANTIAHCHLPVSVQAENTTSTKRCKQCDPDYYLNNSKQECLKGKTLNCEVTTENQADKCTTCLDNHVLIPVTSNRDVCVNI